VSCALAASFPHSQAIVDPAGGQKFRFQRRLANSPPPWELPVFDKEKSFHGMLAWRQEFCDVEAFRVMDGRSFRQLCKALR
jgi:hypothetical protein